MRMPVVPKRPFPIPHPRPRPPTTPHSVSKAALSFWVPAPLVLSTETLSQRVSGQMTGIACR